MIMTLSIVALAILGAVIIGPQNKTPPQKRPNSNAENVPLSVARYSPAPTGNSGTQQQSYYWSLRLTKPVELKDSVGHVTAWLQEGQSVEYVGRSNYTARIRYDGRDYEIPISSTDLK